MKILESLLQQVLTTLFITGILGVAALSYVTGEFPPQMGPLRQMMSQAQGLIQSGQLQAMLSKKSNSAENPSAGAIAGLNHSPDLQGDHAANSARGHHAPAGAAKPRIPEGHAAFAELGLPMPQRLPSAQNADHADTKAAPPAANANNAAELYQLKLQVMQMRNELDQLRAQMRVLHTDN